MILRSLTTISPLALTYAKCWGPRHRERIAKILGGTPVFRGTRVPLQLLFDSLERGHTLEEFLAGYPTVSREMAIAALEEAQQLLSARA